MDDDKTSDTPISSEIENSTKPIGALVTDLIVGAAAAGTRRGSPSSDAHGGGIRC